MKDVTINGSASIGYLYEHFENMRENLEELYKFNKDFVLYPGFAKINHNGIEKVLMRPFIKGPVGLTVIGVVEEPAKEGLKQGKTKLDIKPYVAHVYQFPGDFDVNQFYEHKGNYNGQFCR